MSASLKEYTKPKKEFSESVTEQIKQYFQDHYRLDIDKDNIYAYQEAEGKNSKRIQKEISFHLPEENLVLIQVKELLKNKEFTDGGLRVLNHLNCNAYFLTHQYNTMDRIYTCRCVVSKTILEKELESIMEYMEKEQSKAKILLEMECR